jgi:hypothetical protein
MNWQIVRDQTINTIAMMENYSVETTEHMNDNNYDFAWIIVGILVKMLQGCACSVHRGRIPKFGYVGYVLILSQDCKVNGSAFPGYNDNDIEELWWCIGVVINPLDKIPFPVDSEFVLKFDLDVICSWLFAKVYGRNYVGYHESREATDINT